MPIAPTEKTAFNRTTLPFDGGLSPLTDKSKGVPLFGNTPLLQDLINGEREGFNDIKGRGAWSSEPDSENSNREPGDEYKTEEALQQLDVDRAKGRGKRQLWVAEMEDGSRYEFPGDKESAKFRLRLIGKPFRRLFRRVAADTDVVSAVIGGCAGVVAKKGTGGGVGAAFCVAEGRFLTCAHVVDPYEIGVDMDDNAFMARGVTLELTRDGKTVPAKLIGVSLRKDVALLEADLKSNVLKMSKIGAHAQGEPVLVVGSPKGYENEVSEGILGGLNRVVFLHQGAPRHAFTDAKILPGNSGGPMVSLADGSVIGMMEIIVGKGSDYGLNAAIEAEYIVEALKEMGFELSK